MNSDIESSPESDYEDSYSVSTFRSEPAIAEDLPLNPNEDDTTVDTIVSEIFYVNEHYNIEDSSNSESVNSETSESVILNVVARNALDVTVNNMNDASMIEDSNSNVRDNAELPYTSETENPIVRSNVSGGDNMSPIHEVSDQGSSEAFELRRMTFQVYDGSTFEPSNENVTYPDGPNPITQAHNEGAPLTLYSNDLTRSSSVQPSELEDVTNDEPPSKIAKLECKEKRKRTDSESNDADGETCSICLDAWSNSGDHRLIALKCGHLFGHQCIIRWLKSQNAKTKSCPTCKSKAAVRDIRFIYARKLVAADTSEVDVLKQELEMAKAEKYRAELELQKSLLHQKMYVKQVTELRMQIKDLESKLSAGQNNKNPEPIKKWKLALERNLEICKDNGCRVLTYNCRKYELYVSQQSTNNLFPGFGIKKVSCIDYRLGQFILLHPKPIRDISYSQPNDMVLSVSLDNTAKIIIGQTGQIVHTFNCGMPLWSCCWDELMPQRFYVGAARGVVLVYDVRQPNAYLERLTVPGDYSPIVSLASMPSGFLSCHLSSCWIHRRSGSTYTPQLMPIDGPFLGLNYDRQTEQILVSCRPSQQNPFARHIVCHIDDSDVDDACCGCNTVYTFRGSVKQTLMSKSCFLNVGKETWVAAHSESESAVSLWSVNSEERVQVLPSQDHVIDMCPLSQGCDSMLATLSQNRMRIYKTVSS